jgi:hypothetical protein
MTLIWIHIRNSSITVFASFITMPDDGRLRPKVLAIKHNVNIDYLFYIVVLTETLP